MAETEEILVELLDEGVDVWAPVMARRLPDGLYVLPDSAPDHQKWSIPPDRWCDVSVSRRALSLWKRFRHPLDEVPLTAG